MRTPLHKQLTNYIKLHTRVLYDDIPKYAKENHYKEYTAIRRLQEVRDKDHPNYDPDIDVIMENGSIKWYIYKPAFAMSSQASQERTPPVEQRAVQPEKPRTEPPIASQPTSQLTAKEFFEIYEKERVFLNRPPKQAELRKAIERYKQLVNVSRP